MLHLWWERNWNIYITLSRTHNYTQLLSLLLFPVPTRLPLPGHTILPGKSSIYKILEVRRLIERILQWRNARTVNSTETAKGREREALSPLPLPAAAALYPCRDSLARTVALLPEVHRQKKEIFQGRKQDPVNPVDVDILGTSPGAIPACFVCSLGQFLTASGIGHH